MRGLMTALPAGMGGRCAGLKVCVRAESSNGSGPKYDYDLLTIGAGSGGVRASRFAASYGARVAVVELPFDFVSSETAGGVGGTCVLRGCVPKKLMVYASDYNEGFKDSSGFGWQHQGSPTLDWPTFMAAKRKELMRLNGAYKNTLGGAKVTLVEGKGKVVDAHTVEIDGVRHTAKDILIAVGGRPTKLNIPGAELCITSDEILELPTQPKKITIIGGGYIAVEFAGIFKRLGAEVHVVYRQDLPLRGFDEEVRKFATDQYKQAGLNLHPGCNPVEVRKQPDGRLTAVIKQKDGSTIDFGDNDYVLMATGRAPNTQTLGLAEAGVTLGHKGDVVVDEYSRTNVPSIWAVGDVTDRIALTPVALMEGMALAKTLVLDQPTKPDYWAVASAVFSHPEIATVGYSEEQAIAKFDKVEVFTTSFRPMRNTISGNPLRAFMKLLVDGTTNQVVGAHMVGDHAAEIMQGFAVAVKVGVTKEQMDSVVGIHPSAAEEFVTMRTATRTVVRETAAAAQH
ncbi:MAG: hypothetical protein WDW38_007962 [Sanguina aurantia]